MMENQQSSYHFKRKVQHFGHSYSGVPVEGDIPTVLIPRSHPNDP